MDENAIVGGEPACAPAPRFAIFLVLLAIIPVVLWPEDVWWAIDEPRLIASAWHANNDHTLATHGLTGNFRVMYGPMPTHIYQVLLSITHQPGFIVIMRGLLCSIVTAGSLLWLARSTRLPAWFVAAIIVAPTLTMFQRVLWDASFTIPIGTLALASLASFLRTGKKWPLRITLAAGFLASINHPQALPVFLPIAALIFWRHRPALWADRRGLFWTAAGILVFNGAYLALLAGNILWLVTVAPPTSYPGDGSRLASALAPLLGGHLLNGWDYAHSVARPPGPDWLVQPILWTGRLIYPIIWIGIAAAMSRLPSVIRMWRKSDSEPPVRDVISTVVVAGLVLQLGLFIAGRIPCGPQYFFGTFALHTFLALLGVDVLRNFKLSIIPAASGLACAFVTLGAGWALHTHGDKHPGWPTLRNAREVVQSLNQYEDLPVFTDIEIFQKYPQPIRTMRLLFPKPPAAEQRNAPALLITYATNDGEKTGRIVVEELPTAARPENALVFDAAPLPRDWVPHESTW